jgi:hypothetical protein
MVPRQVRAGDGRNPAFPALVFPQLGRMIGKVKKWCRGIGQRATKDASAREAAKILASQAIGAKTVLVVFCESVESSFLPKGPYEFYVASGTATIDGTYHHFQMDYWYHTEKNAWVPQLVEFNGVNVFDLESSIRATKAAGKVTRVAFDGSHESGIE